MTNNIIDAIATDLHRLDSKPNLNRTNPRQYTAGGVILEPFAKQNNISSDALQKLIKSNSFFKLGKTTIQTGLFSKRDKTLQTIEWETQEIIRKKYLANSDKLVKESASSKILSYKIIQIIMLERSKLAFNPKPEEKKFNFEYPTEDRIVLFKRYFPDELEKYQREGRHESDLEKKFRKRMPKGAEFHFSDGKVANNLSAWVQCVQMAANDVVAFHIRNNEFYDWLEDKVKAPELARLCMMIDKRLQNEEITEKEVKNELLGSINKTSLNTSIFETLILPIIRTLKSNDQSKASDAIDKLINIGDERVVEPLMEKIFDSSAQIRYKIIMGLGKLGDKRATPNLLKVLRHSDDAKDKLFALRTLGVLNDRRAVGVLKDIAKNNDDVGVEAVRVLAEMGKRKR